MIITDITAWLPVRQFEFEEANLTFDENQKCINKFCSELPLALSIYLPNMTHAEVGIEKPSDEIIKDILISSRRDFVKIEEFKFIKIVLDLEYDKELIQKENPDFLLSDSDVKELAYSYFSTVMEYIILLSNLAYPIQLKFLTGRCWEGKRLTNPISTANGLPLNYVKLTDDEWPSLQNITLKEICEWESRLGLYSQGFASTPIQRALASFTHAISQSSTETGELLFWSMQGLEAFYCRGTGDLRKQLSDKSKIFLGEWSDKKNIVGRLYDLRSKFIHGDYNLERKDNDLFIDEQYDKLVGFDTSTNLAIKMLIATLQKCVKDKIINAEFEYKLNITHY